MQITKVMAILAIVTLPLAAQADTLSEDRVKELVLEAIRENPEIVLEAVQIIEQREQQRQVAAAASVLSDNRDVLENDPNAPVLGNPDGDVTVVEFFDYNCPYCRRVKPEIEALLAEDPNVKLVYREWPILGEGSVFAARAALSHNNPSTTTAKATAPGSIHSGGICANAASIRRARTASRYRPAPVTRKWDARGCTGRTGASPPSRAAGRSSPPPASGGPTG